MATAAVSVALIVAESAVCATLVAVATAAVPPDLSVSVIADVIQHYQEEDSKMEGGGGRFTPRMSRWMSLAEEEHSLTSVSFFHTFCL